MNSFEIESMLLANKIESALQLVDSSEMGALYINELVQSFPKRTTSLIQDKASLKKVFKDTIKAALAKKINANALVEAYQTHISKESEEIQFYFQGIILKALVEGNLLSVAKAFINSIQPIEFGNAIRRDFYVVKYYLASNELDEALSQINQLIELYENRFLTATYHLRGMILRQKGDLEGAKLDFLTCLNQDPFFLKPIYAIYFLLMNGVSPEGVIETIRNAVDKNPDEPILQSSLGDALTAIGEVSESIPVFLEAAKLQTVRKHKNLKNYDWPEKGPASPNFIIIGTPKSGTTSAYSYMKNHPQILSPIAKELSFFSNNQRYAYGMDWYMSHFPTLARNEGFITGEGSPGYFYSEEARKRIKKHCVGTKFILFLREPVNRAISGYYQQKKMRGIEVSIGEFFEDNFKSIDEKGLDRFNAVTAGVYYFQLEKWIKDFGKENLLVIQAETFFESPDIVMNRIYQFLGVQEFHKKDFPVFNKGLYPEAPQALIDRLKDFYQPHNEKLYTLLGEKFSW